jgi:hypothetical protein
MADAEQVVGREHRVQLDDEVEVGALPSRAADGIGLVDGRHRDHAVERRDRCAQVLHAVPKVRTQPEDRPH